MRKLTNLLKNKEGSSLVEIIIATAILTLVSSGIVAMLYAASGGTDVNRKLRDDHELAVGSMDTYLANADTTIGTDFPVTINFQYNSTTQTVDCKQIYEGDLITAGDLDMDENSAHRVGITKKK